MESRTFYSEKQKFKQKWINAIINSLLVLTFILAIFIFFSNKYSLLGAIPFLVVGLIFFLFRKMELLLEVDHEKIMYKFSPFHVRKRAIPKKEIAAISVDNYDPISDYGGWGIRFGKNGKAYTVNGSFGLQINFLGKNILIGTMNPKELFIFLKKNNYDPKSNMYD